MQVTKKLIGKRKIVQSFNLYRKNFIALICREIPIAEFENFTLFFQKDETWFELHTRIRTIFIISNNVLMAFALQPFPDAQSPLHSPQKIRILGSILIGLIEHTNYLLAPRRSL